ncbi:retinol dehydrogenase 12-like [Watersipora subatra]|uniref:retinol dehydrogenase 12-like n=1 Tax=Watersipora subatra TaxID=2589382 RepID=UPI00355BD2AB
MEDKKVIIVTGANSGIGFEAAKGLCQLGHDVVISVRDDAKGETTVSAIKAEVPEAQLMYITMEMSDPQSIRDFVEKFLATGKPLHVLINNAGLSKGFRSAERFTARDDALLEITMIVNCMGPFLLTHLLLEKLKESGTESSPARIVNVSSSLTLRKAPPPNGLTLANLMLEGDAYKSGYQAYRNSKLALNLWSNLLAAKLEGSSVILNTVCPGFIPGTGLARDSLTSHASAFAFGLLDSFVGRLFVNTKPVSEGQKRLIKMALDKETQTNGVFYYDDKPGSEAPEVLDQDNIDKIWDLCVKYSAL